jgi:protein O-GlcNAc transferase
MTGRRCRFHRVRRLILYSCVVMFVMAGELSISMAQPPPQNPGGALPVELQPVFREGVQALRAGELGRAEELFSEVLRRGGSTAFVHNNLGIVYQEQSEHRKAIAEFRQAIQLAPKYEAPRVLMGASLLALGRVSEAVRVLARATSLAPNEPLARLELGKAYIRANEPLKAVRQLQILRHIEPKNPEYAYQLGTAYLKLGEWCVAHIRQLNPKSARLYQIMAETYRAQNQLERAKALLEEAARADPSLPGVHLEIATIDLQQGNPGKARAEVQKELAIVPDSAAALALRRRLEGASH